MTGTDVMRALSADISRLNLKDTPKKPSLHKPVQANPTEIWESDTWRACKNGILHNVRSGLQKLRPQDVSRFVNARDRDGNTALIVASAVAHGRKNCKAIITTLLAAGADINTKNQEGRTALMEASLLGGLAAVEILLSPEQGSPADANLRDNMGLRATDLAGTNAILGAERRRRRSGGEHQELLFDHERRRRIVELLDKIRDENTTSTSAHPIHTPTQSDISTNGEEDLIVQLEAKLLQARNETEDLLRVKQTEVEVIKQEYEKQANELSKAKRDLTLAKRRTIAPSQRRSDRTLQFRVTGLKDGPLDTEIDMIRIFQYGLRRGYNTGTPEHIRPTIAYMDMNGHLARNGMLQEEGFIDSSRWVTEAYRLFHELGSIYKQSWFQHTEPQLMALCVWHFRQITNLTLDQFINKQPVGSRVMPEVVEIFVSRKPCPKCEWHKNLVNKITREYNFEFQLIDANVC